MSLCRMNTFVAALAAITISVATAQAAECPLAAKASHAPTVMHVSAETPNIVETAAANEDFSTLVAAVKAAGLAETLSGKGPFTVFAPTNKAFEKLPAGTVESLLKPENKDKLVAVLTYHVVPGKVMSTEAVKLTVAKTVQGGELALKVKDDALMINDAKVTTPDLEASNGVIHVIDSVLLPK